MRIADEVIEPVRKSRLVPLDPQRAFRLFTSEMGRWWPLASHSIAAQSAVDVRFEEHVGGRVVEIAADGSEYPWADVLAWDPPHRFLLSWHPNEDPVAASLLEVRFVATSGGSEIQLEHRGWEEFGGSEGVALRDRYGPGWDVVLAPFVAQAEDG